MMGKCQVVGSASQEDGTETRQSKDSECTDTGGGSPPGSKNEDESGENGVWGQGGTKY